jgi:glyoxylase-like metal-dependent hydrolase (beta-lactamase superfamily II)
MTDPLEPGGRVPGLPGWKVLATPGHTDDSISLYHEEARFLVAGDTVRNYLGGEWNPALTSARDQKLTRKMLLSLEVETVFPGHGPILEGPHVLEGLKQLPPWMP